MAQLNAAVDILKSVLQRHVGSRHRMRCKEILHIVTRVSGTEAAGTGDQIRAKIGGQIRAHLVPAGFDKFPGRIASIGIFEAPCKLYRCVLVADLARD